MIPKEVLATMEALARDGHYSFPDEQILSKVRPYDLASYLKAHGWTSIGRPNAPMSLWQKRSGNQVVEIDAPTRQEWRDYPRLMQTTLDAVASAEGRSQIAVLRDICRQVSRGREPPVTDEERDEIDADVRGVRARSTERSDGAQSRVEAETVARAWLEKRLPKVPLVVVQQHDVDSLVDLLLSFAEARANVVSRSAEEG